jgi:hypothetical protein
LSQKWAAVVIATGHIYIETPAEKIGWRKIRHTGYVNSIFNFRPLTFKNFLEQLFLVLEGQMYLLFIPFISHPNRKCSEKIVKSGHNISREEIFFLKFKNKYSNK